MKKNIEESISKSARVIDNSINLSDSIEKSIAAEENSTEVIAVSIYLMIILFYFF